MLNRFRIGRAMAAVISLGAFGSGAQAAVTFFDTNGTAAGTGVTNGGSYSWEDNNWATVTGGTTATGPWVADTQANLSGGTTGNAYAVNVSATENVAGFNSATSGVTVNVNQAASTTGNVVLTTGAQGFSIATSGFLVLNVPMSGSGQVVQQGTGQLSLLGNNSFTGGVKTTGGQVTNYNNANSFGTGVINFTGTGGQGLVNNGVAGLTIANNILFGSATTSSTNFVGGNGAGGAPGTIWTGTVTLPAAGAVTTLQTGVATSVTKFTGKISGGSAIKIANTGTIIFSNSTNDFTGSTTLSAGTLKAGAANVIASTPQLLFSAGTFNPGGFNQDMHSTTVNLTANSVIDFGAGAAEIDFANSTAISWAGTFLNLTNWDASVDKLRFGTDNTGLLPIQLAKIEFNGAGLGSASLDANGFVVPEPASLSLLGLAGIAMLGRRRRLA